MAKLSSLNFIAKIAAVGAILAVTVSVSAEIKWPSKPLGALITAKPMVMLVASKDHKLFYEAYNDVSDIDGDGKLDIRFNPKIVYYGLFDSKVCYTHTTGIGTSGIGTGDQFNPAKYSSDLTTLACPGQWSGNWLNYVTTSRIDALRKVLYGGFRKVDTATETILERAYIPQDTHSWAKEYTSLAVDGYRISDYTPLAMPIDGRHFFGNVTMGSRNCSTLSNCSNQPPLLSVVTNSTMRVWEWASKERPVLDANHGGIRVDRAVRVKVCVSPNFLNDCKQYGSSFKPVGLLHDYGENESMLFGLITGSYNKNMSGGVLRKSVSSFKDEVEQATGVFKNTATIVKNFDALRIRDFNNEKTDNSYRNGSFRTGPMNEGAYVDWGNPIGEMMYEAVRYFDGKKSPTASFDTSGSHDAAVGLTRVSPWDNPYESSNAVKAAWCSKPNMLVMSDSYPSYDGDQIPGSAFALSSVPATDLINFNGSTLLDIISTSEAGSVKGEKFIGQSTVSNLDYTPSPKTVDSLATVRGLAPEEPSKLGSYYSAAVAYYGKLTGIKIYEPLPTTPVTTKAQTIKIDSNFVTFASSAPTLSLTVQGKTITLVPFAKTIDNGVDRGKGKYQPTNPVVDVYVRTIANTDPTEPKNISVNGGRPYIQYNVIWEADEQGNDFDQDVNSLYTLSADAIGNLTVEVQIIDESTGSNQNIGYIISGTQGRDGVFLVASDKKENLVYFLNTPPGRNPGYCSGEPTSGSIFDECKQLPFLVKPAKLVPDPANRSRETFAPSVSGTNASFLKDPLWYAAKWGGFTDLNGDGKPDRDDEWDTDGDKVPDNYFLVQNPSKLKESLSRAFLNLSDKSGSGGGIIANSTALSEGTFVYQAAFNASRWSGELKAFKATALGVESTFTWNAANKIPIFSSRKIIYGADTGSGMQFTWSNLSAAEKGLIGSELVFDYLRGDRSKELPGGTLRTRSPSTVLGDITHSSPAYLRSHLIGLDTSKNPHAPFPGTVFVGANDGMLHAFNAGTGEERFAYIPSVVMPRLKDLAATDYNEKHQFYVDGDITISDKVKTDGKSYLVGTLGRGGKGLYGLDVTTPDSFSGTDVLWENFSTTDADLGYMLGRPVIAQMNNGDSVVIVGNGYNSINGRAVLLIFNLATGAEVARIDTGFSTDNGLATPGVYDIDGDNKIDLVYAGDIKGNVWKFDVSSSAKSDWKVTFNGAPFFKAEFKDGNNPGIPQPITAPISIVKNKNSKDLVNFGKLFIHFGTGSYFRIGDPGDNSKQSWYGLIDTDNVATSTAIADRSALVPRTIQEVGVLASKPVRVFSAALPNDMVSKRGFYMDLPLGERITTTSRVFNLVEPALIASSLIPLVDECIPGGNGFLNAINPFTGGRLTNAFFDVNGINLFKDDVLSVTTDFIGSVDLGVGLPGEAILIGNRLVVGGSKGVVEDIRVNLGAVVGRFSWREIVRD